jgi:hypothetical protein
MIRGSIGSILYRGMVTKCGDGVKQPGNSLRQTIGSQIRQSAAASVRTMHRPPTVDYPFWVNWHQCTDVVRSRSQGVPQGHTPAGAFDG